MWRARSARTTAGRRAVEVEPGRRATYCHGMVTTELLPQDVPQRRPETEADRLGRIEREEAIIAKAEADIDAGLGIEDDDLEAWLDALDHHPDAPLPSPRSSPASR